MRRPIVRSLLRAHVRALYKKLMQRVMGWMLSGKVYTL
jgi:hypothetical protein